LLKLPAETQNVKPRFNSASVRKKPFTWETMGVVEARRTGFLLMANIISGEALRI
jgi:hypothetical protein